MSSALNKQVGGDHYKNKAIQPVEYILANGLGFCEGCIIKYATRWREKGGIEDLKKIIHYAELLIENEMRGVEETEKAVSKKYSMVWLMDDGIEHVFPVALTYEEAVAWLEAERKDPKQAVLF